MLCFRSLCWQEVELLRRHVLSNVPTATHQLSLWPPMQPSAPTRSVHPLTHPPACGPSSYRTLSALPTTCLPATTPCTLCPPACPPAQLFLWLPMVSCPRGKLAKWRCPVASWQKRVGHSKLAVVSVPRQVVPLQSFTSIYDGCVKKNPKVLERSTPKQSENTI